MSLKQMYIKLDVAYEIEDGWQPKQMRDMVKYRIAELLASGCHSEEHIQIKIVIVGDTWQADRRQAGRYRVVEA